MAINKDFNDAIEDIFLSEESAHKDSYEEGFRAGSEAGNPEGYHLGYHRGAELGRELGTCRTYENAAAEHTPRALSSLAVALRLVYKLHPHTAHTRALLYLRALAANFRTAIKFESICYYLGTVTHYINLNKNTEEPMYSEKVITQLTKVKELIDTFPRTNSEEHDILGLAETIKAQYRKACALLKISSSHPYGSGISF